MALELQSIIHKEGIFDKTNNSISIQQELIYIYKKLYDIRMGLTTTHSTKSKDRLLFPQILYNDIHVNRNQIYYFLKKLVNITRDSQLVDDVIEQDLIEKIILIDINYLLIYYHFYYEHDSLILRTLGIILQPFQRIKEYFREKLLMKEITKQFCIETKMEAFERINTLNNNIESFLNKAYKFNPNFSLKHPIILLIHANFIVMKKILCEDVFFYFRSQNLILLKLVSYHLMFQICC